MGMYGTLRRVTAADAAGLRANPALVSTFLFGEPPVMVTERPPGLLGFLLRLTPIKVQRPADPQPPRTHPPAWPAPAAGEALDLDKAWHGLHFLFTGQVDGGEEPASYLLSGGEEIGPDDDGDLFARLLRPDQVRDFAAFLGGLSAAELTRRFDPERMAALEIYPDVIWKRPEETDQPLGFLLGAFDELRAFTATAADAGDAVVVCVS